MRTLLVAIGTRGDVLPMILLGLRLRERGHDVAFASQGFSEADVERAGFDFVRLEGEAMALLHSGEGRESIASSRARHSVDLWADELRRVADGWWLALERPAAEADVVVSGLLACVVPSEAAAAAGRAHGVVLPFPIEPEWLPLRERLFSGIAEQSFLEPHRDWLDGRRRSRGQRLSHPTMLRALRACGARLLRTWSPSLYPAPRGAEHPTGVIAPSVGDASVLGLPALSEATERWLSEGAPPLFVGFGSMPFPNDAAFCDALVETLDTDAMRAVVQGPWSALEQRLGADRVRVIGPCDHRALLPRCSAAIHHAGAGTTHAVLSAGLPSVACPVVSDQIFVWARRIVELGAGTMVPPRRSLVSELPSAVERALAPEVRQRARALADTLAGEDGLSAAVDAIEEMAS